MTVERIPHDGWELYAGHVARYDWIAGHLRPTDMVNDVACGTGYGAALLSGVAALYRGYDRPGVDLATVPVPGSVEFYGADLDDPAWTPDPADVAVCFETLEHVKDPSVLAARLTATTRRLIAVSVPVVPTKHENPHHLHDFTVTDIPPMFPGWSVVEDWAQPEELSHVWLFGRDNET